MKLTDAEYKYHQFNPFPGPVKTRHTKNRFNFFSNFSNTYLYYILNINLFRSREIARNRQRLSPSDDGTHGRTE